MYIYILICLVEVVVIVYYYESSTDQMSIKSKKYDILQTKEYTNQKVTL